MSAVRDMAQGLMDRFAGFARGHSTSERVHPGVGVAFIIAALIVLLLGLRWFGETGEASGTTDQSWALDLPGSGSPTTTIGASPEAIAVRVGTAIPHGAEQPAEDQTVTIGIPGTSIEIEIPLGPTTTTGPNTTTGGSTGGGSTGGGTSGGGGSTTPTTRRTSPTTRPGGSTVPSTDPPPTDPPPTDPPPTDPPTTVEPTTEPPTTEEPTTEPPTTEASTLGVTVPTSVDPPPATDAADQASSGLLAGLDDALSSLLG
jgi:hypothetical protein